MTARGDAPSLAGPYRSGRGNEKIQSWGKAQDFLKNVSYTPYAKTATMNV